MQHTSTQEKNHLSQALSPYLLQHKENPVHWFEWGRDAFEKAKKEDKLIFLSTGYSACHWCHVMAHESFEDDEVAAFLNEHFVSIKVDREERPDIDGIFMTVCQIMTGRGGWPLSVILTPLGKPVFAGTYIPKHGRYGSVGFLELLSQLSTLWKKEPMKLALMGEKIHHGLREIAYGGSDSACVDLSTCHEAFASMENSYDDEHGGFGTYQKFPSPQNLVFLLNYYRVTGNNKALAMIEGTLHAIGRGGMRDHLGGGFHRYATDRQWLLPHFEKMLYDQATISWAALKAYEETGQKCFSTLAKDGLDYALTCLEEGNGGFYSSEDADSEGEEGKFYLWTTDELAEVLSDDEYRAVVATYHCSKEGNFHDEASGKATGKNILHRLSLPLKEWKRAAPSDTCLGGAMKKLLTIRSSRIRPGCDTKVLTDWNGLFIAALAMAGRLLDNRVYVEKARRGGTFLKQEMTSGTRLFHRYKDGEKGIPGYLDDYAFTAWAMIELYEVTDDETWLSSAREYMTVVDDHFAAPQGGYYFTADDGESLLVRLREGHDGPYPSGNSVAAHNWIRLAQITGDQGLAQKATAIVSSFGPLIKRAPSAHVHLLSVFLNQGKV